MLLARTEGRRAPQVSHKYASRRIETERKPRRTETVSQFELSTFAADTSRVEDGRRLANERPPPSPLPPSPFPSPPPPHPPLRRILVERVTKALGARGPPGRGTFHFLREEERRRRKRKKKRWTHTRKTAHSRLSVIKREKEERKKRNRIILCVRACGSRTYLQKRVFQREIVVERLIIIIVSRLSTRVSIQITADFLAEWKSESLFFSARKHTRVRSRNHRHAHESFAQCEIDLMDKDG